MANKTDLIEKVQVETQLSQKDAEHAVNATFEAIKNFQAEGEPLVIVGFGRFEVKHRNARKGRNPKTGKEIEIKAKNAPTFKPAPAFKDIV